MWYSEIYKISSKENLSLEILFTFIDFLPTRSPIRQQLSNVSVSENGVQPPRQKTICLWSLHLSGPPGTGKGLRSRVIIMLLFTLKISLVWTINCMFILGVGWFKRYIVFLLSILYKIKVELFILQLNTVLLNTVLRQCKEIFKEINT